MYTYNGYMILSFRDNGKSISITEHKLNALINNSLKDVYNKDNVVHHENHYRFDNRVENLEVMSRSEHNTLHNAGENNHMYGRTGENNPNYGTTRSPEARQKMSQVQKGNKNPMFNSCIKIKKYECKKCKQGFSWRAYPYTKNGKQKTLQSVNLDKCIEKVVDFINSPLNGYGYIDFEIIGGDSN